MRILEELKPKPQELNKRTIKFDSEEHNFRAISEVVDETTVRKIRGYALLFDVMGSPWMGSQWKEKIDKTALSETKLNNTFGLLNHESTWALGKAGKNMNLTVDAIGLFIEITLGNTWIDDYVFDRVEKGILDSMSFWFDSKTVVVSDWENKIDSIIKINEIYEVSLVTFPAYPQTVVVAQEETTTEDQRSNENNDELDKRKALALLELEMEG